MIRLATADDAAEIVEIYRPAVEGSTTSFETVTPSVDEMRQRIESCLEQYPWIVETAADSAVGSLRGYAYAAPHHVRAAYRWSANVSVYVAPQSQRQGVARRLYQTLFAMLAQQGIRRVLAGITVPNPASHDFHRSLGFELVGVYPQVGYKLGRWLDVTWVHRPIGEGTTSEPAELIAFHKIAGEWQGDLIQNSQSSQADSTARSLE